MGTYNNSAEEIAEKINDALSIMEGDFTIEELKKAFKIVKLEQEKIISGK